MPLSEAILHQATISALPDFEDNIQLVSAVAISADHVITRNKKDFQPALMSILTPEEWLAVAAVTKIEVDLQR